MANNSLTLDYENGDYTLVAGQGTWIPPAGSNLGLADNQEVIRNVGFTLPYPGGSTGTIRICSNGWITDGIFTGGSNILPDPSLFLNHTMWAPMWRDLNPAAGGSVWYDVTAQRCVISWISVPNFFNNGSSTFQVQWRQTSRASTSALPASFLSGSRVLAGVKWCFPCGAMVSVRVSSH